MRLDAASIILIVFVVLALAWGIWYEHSGVKKKDTEQTEKEPNPGKE